MTIASAQRLIATHGADDGKPVTVFSADGENVLTVPGHLDEAAVALVVAGYGAGVRRAAAQALGSETLDVRSVRLRAGMTQRELAEWLSARLGRHYDKPQVSRWESGSKPIPPSVASVLLVEIPSKPALTSEQADIKGVDLKGIREDAGMGQAAMAAWLNERLGRKYSNREISAWEVSKKPVPGIVAELLCSERPQAHGA